MFSAVDGSDTFPSPHSHFKPPISAILPPVTAMLVIGKHLGPETGHVLTYFPQATAGKTHTLPPSARSATVSTLHGDGSSA